MTEHPAARIVPCSLNKARAFVGDHHRHNPAPKFAMFAVGLEQNNALVGVAIVSHPNARALDDGVTCEVTRLCTDGTRNACSKLYGAAARAAKALGWKRIITYTLASEPGTSLRASGFLAVAKTRANEVWDRPSRRRVQIDLFGNHSRPMGAKVRWEKTL